MSYALAALAAAVVRTLGLMLEEMAMHGPGSLLANGWASFVGVPLASALVAFIAAAPFTTAVLVVAETRRWRGALPFVVAGAVIGPLTQLALGLVDGQSHLVSLGLHTLDVIAGAAGGWVYWAVAVRAAPPPPAGR